MSHSPGSWWQTWWQHEVIDGGKGPILLTFIAFVVTFAATRTITRLIRAGRGPFHNVSSGGVHLHHSTPGIILLVTGGFVAVGTPGPSAWIYVAGAMIGVGASLVLDEFAMIFHLEDDYWTKDGQLSVSVVSLAAACLGLAATGLSPLGINGLPVGIAVVRGVGLAVLALHLVCVCVTAAKGKYPTALIAVFLIPVSVIAALRLARPHSPWARRFYGPERRAHAATRTARFDARWGPVRRRWDNAVGGAPSTEPATPPTSRAAPRTGDGG
ncbi:hypothetical protein P0W64_02430 [Tsukamurella sp. 8F]|uniref:hypothetical protein n=1 Tax=unclassified Tsukamurella TaxID=2633480 RepID=UPI0023B90D38|nr:MULTISPECIES: hypothetical protein [unclassified Tsukamurella]MDF0528663.1 hypothetical protein [Tsukamurella sp. 8J]MDF0585625.1 hypothetical protein [Tsukamurella sp. 8F]